jgi:S1-C subfamily serine protease
MALWDVRAPGRPAAAAPWAPSILASSCSSALIAATAALVVAVMLMLSMAPAETEALPVPSEAQASDVVNAAAAGTVKVVARGCGIVSSGSGFLVAPDLVMTNAHVLGDLPELAVEDRDAEHPASVALIDETTDVAILRAGKLTGRPLRLSNRPLDQRVKGVVLGFPHGGPLRSVAAAVRDPEPVFVAHAPLHRMFYRSVVQLQAHVERGIREGRLSG